MKLCLLASAIFLFSVSTCLAEHPASDAITVLPDLAYKSGDKLASYEAERCKVDLYLPKERKGFPTLVWFHGGGLTGGGKTGENVVKIARSLAAAGLAVVVPNYRRSPKATFPAYIQDAAAAFAWTRSHIGDHGGDPARLFIGGHSAGAYLSLMLAMDTRYLGDLGIEPSAVAGFIPVSGQTMTHRTVREERGIGEFTIIADEAAPVHFARKDTPPILVLYADNDMPARAEENAYFVALMKSAGNVRTTGLMIRDRTHGSIAHKIAEGSDPAKEAILQFVQAATGSKGQANAQ